MNLIVAWFYFSQTQIFLVNFDVPLFSTVQKSTIWSPAVSIMVWMLESETITMREVRLAVDVMMCEVMASSE